MFVSTFVASSWRGILTTSLFCYETVALPYVGSIRHFDEIMIAYGVGLDFVTVELTLLGASRTYEGVLMYRSPSMFTLTLCVVGNCCAKTETYRGSVLNKDLPSSTAADSSSGAGTKAKAGDDPLAQMPQEERHFLKCLRGPPITEEESVVKNLNPAPILASKETPSPLGNN
ncbi:hypothetical protein Tco_1523635 [Tanacetum coccineum]